MGWYRNTANAIIIDDRGNGVHQGGVAYLSKKRAEAIRAIRPGTLIDCDPPEGQPQPAAKRKRKPRIVEVEVSTDSSSDPDSDPEPESPIDLALRLHYKKRIRLAESLGGGDGISRRKADSFLRGLKEDAFPALLSEVSKLEG